ncbi:MAG: hypothetical protein JO278_04835, partial [Dyella sp.]|nr:hypothetical protein [Dyella sp.]
EGCADLIAVKAQAVDAYSSVRSYSLYFAIEDKADHIHRSERSHPHKLCQRAQSVEIESGLGGCFELSQERSDLVLMYQAVGFHAELSRFFHREVSHL